MRNTKVNIIVPLLSNLSHASEGTENLYKAYITRFITDTFGKEWFKKNEKEKVKNIRNIIFSTSYPNFYGLISFNERYVWTKFDAFLMCSFI